MIPDRRARRPIFCVVNLVPSRESGGGEGSAAKARLVNKLGLFLTACVNASRIEREGSIFFFFSPLSSLSSRSRLRVVRRLCFEGGHRVLGFLWRIDEIRLKSNYKTDNHFRSFTIFRRVLTSRNKGKNWNIDCAAYIIHDDGDSKKLVVT